MTPGEQSRGGADGPARWLRRRGPLAASAVALVAAAGLAVAGCGDEGEGDPAAWAADVCGALVDFRTQARATADTAAAAVRSAGGAEEARAAIQTGLDGLGSLEDELDQRLSDAGPPPIPGGDEIEQQIETAQQDLVFFIQGARQRVGVIERLPAAEAVAVAQDLVRGAREAQARARADIESIKASTAEGIEELRAAIEATPACQELAAGG